MEVSALSMASTSSKSGDVTTTTADVNTSSNTSGSSIIGDVGKLRAIFHTTNAFIRTLAQAKTITESCEPLKNVLNLQVFLSLKDISLYSCGGYLVFKSIFESLEFVLKIRCFSFNLL